MALLAPHYDIIGLADAPIHVDFAEPGGTVGYGPIAMSYSFDGYYNATENEAEWLRTKAHAYEQVKSLSEIWDDLVRQAPPIVREWDAEAKAAEYRAMQPRHCSVYTKPQPSAKARKAARKRAKAGRKASR